MASRRRQASKTQDTEATVDFKKKLRLEENSKERMSENEDAEGDTLTPGSKSTQSTRSLRGKTQMHCLAVQKCQGIKKDIELNELGQPIGHVGSQMLSYIGVLARDKVRITYDSWKNVPLDVKELIWESVYLSFNIHPSWKGACLSSANSKWRQFKTKLTNEFVYARIDSPELNKPPAEYPFITASDWSDFVISRLSDYFKKLREQQKDRRGQYSLHYFLKILKLIKLHFGWKDERVKMGYMKEKNLEKKSPRLMSIFPRKKQEH